MILFSLFYIRSLCFIVALIFSFLFVWYYCVYNLGYFTEMNGFRLFVCGWNNQKGGVDYKTTNAQVPPLSTEFYQRKSPVLPVTHIFATSCMHTFTRFDYRTSFFSNLLVPIALYLKKYFISPNMCL